MSEPKPWERQPKESVKAFEAFVVYRDLGGERSLDSVARQLSKSKTILARWSGKFRWVDRIAAYEDYLAQERTKARLATEAKQAAKWAERQAQHREGFWQLSQDLKKKAEDMLKFPLARVTNTVETDDQGRATRIQVVEPARWTMGHLATLSKVADELGRLASELPTEVIDFVTLLQKKGLPLDQIFKDLIETFKDVNGE